jgi:hypothetical protein
MGSNLQGRSVSQGGDQHEAGIAGIVKFSFVFSTGISQAEMLMLSIKMGLC